MPPKKPVPVFDYRGNKYGAKVHQSKIKDIPKCLADGTGKCTPITNTPCGLARGILVKQDGKDKIIYNKYKKYNKK